MHRSGHLKTEHTESVFLLRRHLGIWPRSKHEKRTAVSAWETWTVAAADGVRFARVRWEINFLLTFETAPFFCVYPVLGNKEKFTATPGCVIRTHVTTFRNRKYKITLITITITNYYLYLRALEIVTHVTVHSSTSIAINCCVKVTLTKNTCYIWPTQLLIRVSIF